MAKSYDWRSDEAKEYRKLYNNKEWKALRRKVLVRDMFKCQRCGIFLTGGKTKPNSAVVNHKIPHKGNLVLFFNRSNLEAVCWTCHSGPIQSIERRGYDVTIGDDGWPIDPNHRGLK